MSANYLGATVNAATLTLEDDDISARIAATDPATLTEQTLHGAQLTVNLSATEYASPLTTGDFALEIQPQGTQGLSIASVNRVNNERAVLTLGFTGDIASDLTLSVVVDSAANEASTRLETGTVPVTQALKPGRVGNLRLTPGPGSLEVSWNTDDDADGYVVQWKLSSESNYANQREVSGGSTTRITLGDLRGETEYSVRMIATSRFASDGDPSDTATATTLPADAIISATDPSPLTENNLGGARLTVTLLRNVWYADGPLHASYFSVSGVPGVSVAGVERLSDTDVAVTIDYDVTDPATDFDEDATLTVRIDGCAFYRCPTRISAITPVAAVVEPPPAQVRNVRVTPGPRYISVRWDPVPDANVNPDAGGYIVTWSPAHACGMNGWSSREIRRSTITRYSIGALCPGETYTVRVIATRERGPDGPASASHQATTPEVEVILVKTQPSPLTEDNLHRARLTVDLEGVEWHHVVHGQHNRFQLGRPNDCSGHRPGDDPCRPFPVNRSVVVTGVERVSDSRVIVSLRARNVNLGGQGLWLRFDHETYTLPHHQQPYLMVRVVAPGHERSQNRMAGVTVTAAARWR